MPIWLNLGINLKPLLAGGVWAPAGSPDLYPKWVRLAPNGTNPGLFRSELIFIWLIEPKYNQSDVKMTRICLILRQSNPVELNKHP